MWIDGERVKVTVNLLAAWGGRLRIEAMDPQGGTAADLATDGQSYCLLDVRHDCGDCGPATPETVARLLRIAMPPDDVVAILFGSTPVLAQAATTSHWDARAGREIVELAAGGVTQRIELDGRPGAWDVLDSELRGADGKTTWHVAHKGFHEVRTTTGARVRMPSKSLLEQGDNSVTIEWREVQIGAELDVSKFRLALQPGLRACVAP